MMTTMLTFISYWVVDKWSPIYTVDSILTSILSLLEDPNPDSPANPGMLIFGLSTKKHSFDIFNKMFLIYS